MIENCSCDNNKMALVTEVRLQICRISGKRKILRKFIPYFSIKTHTAHIIFYGLTVKSQIFSSPSDSSVMPFMGHVSERFVEYLNARNLWHVSFRCMNLLNNFLFWGAICTLRKMPLAEIRCLAICDTYKKRVTYATLLEHRLPHHTVNFSVHVTVISAIVSQIHSAWKVAWIFIIKSLAWKFQLTFTFNRCTVHTSRENIFWQPHPLC